MGIQCSKAVAGEIVSVSNVQKYEQLPQELTLSTDKNSAKFARYWFDHSESFIINRFDADEPNI